jgi:hypothetical protein
MASVCPDVGSKRWSRAVLRAGSFLLVCVAALGFATSCTEKEKAFPDQIPDIKAALGTLLRAVSLRDPAILDSISTDDRLYGDVVYMLGTDSLTVLSRRIQNPIDSAHVIMTIAPRDSSGSVPAETYACELFLTRRGDNYWFVDHRLTRSPR